MIRPIEGKEPEHLATFQSMVKFNHQMAEGITQQLSMSQKLLQRGMSQKLLHHDGNAEPAAPIAIFTSNKVAPLGAEDLESGKTATYAAPPVEGEGKTTEVEEEGELMTNEEACELRETKVHLKKLKFLFDAYEPRCYYWEVVSQSCPPSLCLGLEWSWRHGYPGQAPYQPRRRRCPSAIALDLRLHRRRASAPQVESCRKLSLTGWMVFILPGTALQIVLGLTLCEYHPAKQRSASHVPDDGFRVLTVSVDVDRATGLCFIKAYSFYRSVGRAVS